MRVEVVFGFAPHLANLMVLNQAFGFMECGDEVSIYRAVQKELFSMIKDHPDIKVMMDQGIVCREMNQTDQDIKLLTRRCTPQFSFTFDDDSDIDPCDSNQNRRFYHIVNTVVQSEEFGTHD